MSRARQVANMMSSVESIVFNEASADVDFRIEGNGDANMLVVDAGNDRVGIGTASPEGKLTVFSGDASVAPSANADEIFVENSGHAGITIGSGSSSTGNIFFADTDDLAVGQMSYNHDTNYMTFATAGAVRFAINSTGNIGINSSGTVHSTIKLQIKGASNTSSDYSFFSEGSSSNLFYCRNDGYIWAASTINIGSDERMKENINYITDDVLPKINQLKLSKFDYIEGQNDQYGFIAQDVEEVFPEFVNDGGAIGSVAGEYKTLTYDFLFSHSLKAIQELSAKNDALEAKITALENA